MKILLIPVIIVLLITISAVVFIGGGYLISLIIPLTLFQASELCIGATFVLVFIITVIIAAVSFNTYLRDYDYEEEDDEDYEVENGYDYEDEDDTVKRKFTVINKGKIGRNEPCPCGSGKKYKHCCGN